MTFSRIPCWPAAYGPGKPNAPGGGHSLDLCESNVSWNTAWPWEPCCGGTSRDFGLCGAQGSRTKEDPSHSWCGLLSFTGTMMHWLAFFWQNTGKNQKKRFFVVVVVVIRILKISGCGCLVLLILVCGKAEHHAWSVRQRNTFYLMGARTQRRMESHHLLQRYAPWLHRIISLAPTSWCFCHCQITKPFTWDFGNIPDPNSNT